MLVLRRVVHHPPAAERLRLQLAARPPSSIGVQAPVAFSPVVVDHLVVELLDGVRLAVHVEVEAEEDVVDVRQRPLLGPDRDAVGVVAAEVDQRPGQPDLRQDDAVLAEPPLHDVNVPAERVRAPEGERLRLRPALARRCRWAIRSSSWSMTAAFVVTGLPLKSYPWQVPPGRQSTAGLERDHVLPERVVALVLRPRLAGVVRHEHLGDGGVLEDGLALELHVGEDDALAQVNLPVERPPLPLDRPAAGERSCPAPAPPRPTARRPARRGPHAEGTWGTSR